MESKPLTEKRKIPKQRRSRETVEAILEASARVLVEDGFDELTTNRVAARAGVSIGSLYQYFPNKESLVRTLFERHLAEAKGMRPAALSPRGGLSLRDRIRTAVGWHLDAHAATPALHQALSALAPRVIGSDEVRALERLYHAAVRFQLQPYEEEIGAERLEVASFVVACCLEALTHGAVIHHPELLEKNDLAAEMTDLIVGYLSRSPRDPPRRLAE